MLFLLLLGKQNGCIDEKREIFVAAIAANKILLNFTPVK